MLVSFDYNQMELRLLAHFANDMVLLDAFQQRVDVFRLTASMIFEKESESDVTDEERTAAKTIVYGLMYGLGVASLQEQLKSTSSRWNAEELTHTFFSSFPRLCRFLHETKRHAVSDRCYTTLSGHRRAYLDDDMHYCQGAATMVASDHVASSPAPADSAGKIKRIALSYLIQSSASEILKDALLEIEGFRLAKNSSGSGGRDDLCVVMTAHDEVILAVDESRQAQVVAFIAGLAKRQRDRFNLTVDLDVTIRFGRTLADL